MEVVSNLENYKLSKGSIVTVGTFDGVHLAHQKILTKLASIGKENDLEVIVITFNPHPRQIVYKDNKIELVTSIDEKIELLSKLGVIDKLIVIPFTTEFSKLSPESFVKDILVDKLCMKSLYVGFDHGFGKNREGDTSFLKKIGLELGFNVVVQDSILNEGIKISSSRIRNLIHKGNFESTENLLGRDYSISGTVIHGEGRGKKINFPTANVDLTEKDKCLPENGVYIVGIKIDKEFKEGVMNIGVKPTFGVNKKSIEVHILDFDKDVYGQVIEVSIFKKIREEKKFSSINELKLQISNDIKLTEKYFQEKKD